MRALVPCRFARSISFHLQFRPINKLGHIFIRTSAILISASFNLWHRMRAIIVKKSAQRNNKGKVCTNHTRLCNNEPFLNEKLKLYLKVVGNKISNGDEENKCFCQTMFRMELSQVSFQTSEQCGKKKKFTKQKSTNSERGKIDESFQMKLDMDNSILSLRKVVPTFGALHFTLGTVVGVGEEFCRDLHALHMSIT